MPAARRPRLIVPQFLPSEQREVWWAGTKVGYHCGYNALNAEGRQVPEAPKDMAPRDRQVWWMGYRTAHPFGFQDYREGLPFTEPPAEHEHVWPEDE